MRIIDEYQKENYQIHQSSNSIEELRSPNIPNHIEYSYHPNKMPLNNFQQAQNGAHQIPLNSKSMSPYKQSSQMAQNGTKHLPSMNQNARKTFIIRRNNGHPNQMMANKQRGQHQTKTVERFTSAETFFIEKRQNNKSKLQSYLPDQNSEEYAENEIEEDDPQDYHDPEKHQEQTPTFHNKKRKVYQKLQQQVAPPTSAFRNDQKRQSGHHRQTFVGFQGLNPINQTTEHIPNKMPLNRWVPTKSNKHQLPSNFLPYQNNPQPQGGIKSETNSLERQITANNNRNAQRRTVYGLPFVDCQELIENQTPLQAIQQEQKMRKSGIFIAQKQSNSKNRENQEKQMRGTYINQAQTQSNWTQNINRRVTTAVDNSQYKDFNGVVEHFPQSRANRFLQNNDYCKIKVNKEDKALKHLTSDHQENLNLMFYDFNNFQAQDSTSTSNANPGDRVPSRNFRSRGRVGVASRDNQRQTSPFINRNQKFNKFTHDQPHITAMHQAPHPNQTFYMEAIREEEVYH